MKSQLLEIVLLSEDNPKKKMMVEWLVKTVLPIILKQDDDTKKFVLNTLTETSPIYMS